LIEYFGVQEIEIVIVSNLFIAWSHVTAENVCPYTLFTVVCVTY